MMVDGMIERVWLSDLAGAPKRRTIGSHEFQRWLKGWWALERDGWDVTIVVALDGFYSHAVAMACRPAGYRSELLLPPRPPEHVEQLELELDEVAA